MNPGSTALSSSCVIPFVWSCGTGEAELGWQNGNSVEVDVLLATKKCTKGHEESIEHDKAFLFPFSFLFRSLRLICFVSSGCHSSSVEIGAALVNVNSLLPLCESQGWIHFTSLSSMAFYLLNRLTCFTLFIVIVIAKLYIFIFNWCDETPWSETSQGEKDLFGFHFHFNGHHQRKSGQVLKQGRKTRRRREYRSHGGVLLTCLLFIIA